MSSYAVADAASGGLPLRANFFRAPPLGAAARDALAQTARSHAAASLHQSFNEQWRYVPPEKDGTQLRKDTSNLATSCRVVRAAAVLRCQEHELNRVVANTTTESWREFMRKCFGKYFLDSMILHAFAPSDSTRAQRAATATTATDERATIGGPGAETEDAAEQQDADADAASDEHDEPEELLSVKWGAFDTGGQGKRDLCVLDYLTTATLPSDSETKVYMWCFSSVEGERVGCMGLKDTHGIARATLSKLGVFWRRVSDEETEVIVCGSFASKHAKYVSAIFLQSLNRLQGIVEDLRLSNQIYLHRSTWVKDHERSSCHLCMRNFYALRRKHHCRKCGEVICSDCSVVETVDLPVIGYSKLRLCKVCCLKAKSTPLKRDDRANVFDHLVRARSLSNIHAPLASPYTNSRMSFADSGSGSSGGERTHAPFHTSAQHQQAVAQSIAAARAELLVEASSRSSSSFSSSNTNDFELTDSLDEYTPTQQQQPTSAAPVHPVVMAKDARGLNSGTVSTASTASSTPMLGNQDDDDYDDFIDVRTLNKQLCAMEQKQQQQHKHANSNMFDLLCELACQTLSCPIASVSILDGSGTLIRSASGLRDKPELDEELTLFIEKVMGSTPTIVLDANVDKQVTSLFTKRGSPQIRFFAGCPIHSRTGKKLGYVCVADFTKRDTLGASCAFTMERLATLAVTTMERNVAKQQGEPYAAGSYGNNQTSHQQHQHQHHHPAAIFDRPNGQAAQQQQTQTRHRQSNAAHQPFNVPSQYQPPPQYQSAAQAYQYQDAYHHQAAQPLHARVYDVADTDVPVMVGSPVSYGTRAPPPPHPSAATSSQPVPPVAPLPRQYNEYSAGYYEAQERMRKLLIKSYHTSQQLATGSSPMGPTAGPFHAQY